MLSVLLLMFHTPVILGLSVLLLMFHTPMILALGTSVEYGVH